MEYREINPPSFYEKDEPEIEHIICCSCDDKIIQGYEYTVNDFILCNFCFIHFSNYYQND